MYMFDGMQPMDEDEDSGMSEQQKERAELGDGQTVFSERTDKVELMGVDERGKGDKDEFHRDL